MEDSIQNALMVMVVVVVAVVGGEIVMVEVGDEYYLIAVEVVEED